MDYEIENARCWDDEQPPGRRAVRAPKKTKPGARNAKQPAQPLEPLVLNNGPSNQQPLPQPNTPPPSSTSAPPVGGHGREFVAPLKHYTDSPTTSRQHPTESSARTRLQNHGLAGRNRRGAINRFYNNTDEEGIIGQSVFAIPNIYNDPGVISGDEEAPGAIVYEGPDGFLRDSSADKRARDGVPADDHISLPARRPAEFDERFFGLRNNHLRHIAIKTGTHLSVPENSVTPEIGIWGTKDQIDLAKRDLRALMEHITREIEISLRRTGGAWEKIKAAPSERKQKWLDQQALDEWIRRKYRRTPAEEWFPVVGVLVWPMKEVDPQQPLGASFEALDDIRFENQVHITMARAQSMLRILGSDEGGVAMATERVFGVFCEIAARNRKPNRKLLVRPPGASPSGTTVRLITHHNLKDRQVTIKRNPETVGAQVALSTMPGGKRWMDMWKEKGEKMDKANYRYLKKVVQQGLRDILYFRGHATMKIHFGTLLLFAYKMPVNGEFGLEEFCEMARHSQTIGEVVKYIGEESVAKELVHECFVRNDLFQPAETGEFVFKDEAYETIIDESASVPSYPHPHEANIEPSYHATLVCRTYDDKGCTNDIRLEVEFGRIPGDHPVDVANDAGNLYKVGLRRWLQLPVGPGVPLRAGDHSTKQKGPFDIKLADLENDIAWQFQMVTYNLTRDTDIYPIFAEFVRKLRIEEIPDQFDPMGAPAEGTPDRRRTVPRVSYVNLPGMSVEAVTLKTKYQYWLRGTSYLFEITKYEHFNTTEINDIYPDGVQNSWRGLKTVHDTRWGASLQNSHWSNTLSKQKGLGVGFSGGWKPEVGDFFKSSGIGGFNHPEYTRQQNLFSSDVVDPWGGDGFRECITRINEIAEFIGGVKAKVGALRARRVGSGGFVGCEEFDE